MRALDIDNRIVGLMTHFVAEVKGFNAMDRTDINRVAQNVLVPLLGEVCGYQQLRNLDIETNVNFPGIDLADDDAQVAIQITSTASITKIKHTLEQFLKERAEFEIPLHHKYRRLIVYIITEKQKTYSQESCDKILKGRFPFDAGRDIWDFKSVLAEIQGLPERNKRRVIEILEEQVGHTLTNLAQEWYSLRTGQKLSEPFVARRFLRESQIGSVLMHLARFEAELPRGVPFFWSDAADHAEHEREMLRYKLRKEDTNTLSFRATDDYLDELKAFVTKARKSHKASERDWKDALRTDRGIEDLMHIHDRLWSDFTKSVAELWDKEVKPYLETLVLLTDESPDAFVRKKLEANASEVLESVARKNRENRDAFWSN